MCTWQCLAREASDGKRGQALTGMVRLRYPCPPEPSTGELAGSGGRYQVATCKRVRIAVQIK